MSTCMKKTTHCALAAAATLLAALASPVLADDTEIYLSGSVSAGSRPNVLFILDASGSMGQGLNGSYSSKPSRMDILKSALRTLLNKVDNVNIGIMTFTGSGNESIIAPVRYPVAYVNEDAFAVEQKAEPPFATFSVSASNDDAMQNQSDTVVTLNSETLSLGNAFDQQPTSFTVEIENINNGEDTDDAYEDLDDKDVDIGDDTLYVDAGSQITGLRFRGINIDPNAEVMSATLELKTQYYNKWWEVPNETTDILIDLQASDDADTFYENDGNISARPTIGNTTTTQAVLWSNVDNSRGEREQSPDVSSLLTELVKRPGWVSGNDIAFILSAAKGERHFSSRDDGSDDAARLNVSWGSSIASRKITGLRFDGLNIPQGADITSVKLVVTSANNTNEAMDVTIYGEAADSAQPFADSLNNIGGRTKTTNSAAWKLPPAEPVSAWIENEQYEYTSGELTAVIQEIVDRPDWCGGNALALIMQANIDSNRAIYSRDESGSEAPKLQIEFESDVPLNSTRITGQTNTGCARIQVSAQVDSVDDDAEETEDSGVMRVDTTQDADDLDMGDRLIGVRFETVPLPSVAHIEIEKADITFRTSNSSGSSGSTSDFTIYGHKSSASAAFTESDNNNISDRTKTTSSSANWDVDGYLSNNKTITSPDISPVVQEIIGESGWEVSQTMTFIIDTSGTNRPVSTFDDSPADAPLLNIVAKYHRAGEVGLPPIFNVRERLLSIVDELQPDSGTPIVEALYEGVRYFRGQTALYGKDRLGKSSRRISHPDSYTGGATDPVGCTFSSSDSCEDEEITGTATYVSPITDPCAQNHIVFLSDGQPDKGWGSNNDAVAARIETLLGSEAGNPVTECTLPGDANDLELCGRELTEFIGKYDQSEPVFETQRIITHTIAFALASNEDATNFLRDLATQVSDDGSDTAGLALQANNSTELLDAFETILRQAVNDPASFAAPSLSINSFNRFFNGDDIFFSFFEPSTRPLWEGNVKRFKLCSDPATQNNCKLGTLIYYPSGDTSQPPVPATNASGEIFDNAYSVWSTVPDGALVTKGGAGQHVPIPANRDIYTYLGGDNTPSLKVDLSNDPSDTNHEIENDNTDLTNAQLGVADDTERAELISWIRGDDVDDAYEDTDMRWRISDPLHSSPVAINYAVAGGEPVTKLVVGTNEGGIRMINAKSGIEEWLFIPPEILSRQADAKRNSGSVRFYGIDGTPSVRIRDVHQDGTIQPNLGDYVHLYIGMRRGGSRYYALDITPGSALVSPGAANLLDSIPPKFMWSVGSDDSGFERLGDTWSKPVPTRIRMQDAGGSLLERQVVIFGGGYDDNLDSNYAPALPDPTQGNAIFIVDAFTGELIWTASSDLNATTVVADMNYAIPSDVSLLDSDGDSFTDRLYVADVAGQLWRVDLAPDMKDGVAGSTKVGKLAELSDLSSPYDPLHKRRFFYPPDIVEVLDTTYSSTSRYNLLLFASGDRANPLDETVQDKVYAIRDYHVNAIPTSGYTINTSNLVDVTQNLFQDGATEEIRDQALDDLRNPNTVGWFFDLEADGEKGLAPGTTLEGVYFFTTYIPDATTGGAACKLKNIGAGRLYAVNIYNGIAVYPWNETTTGVTKEDRYMEAGGLGGIPPEFVPVFQEKGVTGCVGTNCGINTEITLPRYRSYWSESLE